MAEFRGITVGEFCEAMAKANARYDGNLHAYDVRDTSGPKKGPAVTFRLTTVDNGPDAKGARGGFRRGKGPKGRDRTASACWHAWYDVFATCAAIGIGKGREVRTLATSESGFKWYESDPVMGVAEFCALMDGSRTNYGSSDNPTNVRKMCTCEDED